jgi:hypothetical protein
MIFFSTLLENRFLYNSFIHYNKVQGKHRGKKNTKCFYSILNDITPFITLEVTNSHLSKRQRGDDTNSHPKYLFKTQFTRNRAKTLAINSKRAWGADLFVQRAAAKDKFLLSVGGTYQGENHKFRGADGGEFCAAIFHARTLLALTRQADRFALCWRIGGEMGIFIQRARSVSIGPPAGQSYCITRTLLCMPASHLATPPASPAG